MSGAIGFDPASLQAAASWRVENDTNYTEALNWISSAVDPNLAEENDFASLSVKQRCLENRATTQKQQRP